MTVAMTETEWQEQVVDLAHLLGWRHLHIRRTRGRGNAWTTSTNVVGWPDLLLWSPRHPGLHIAAELKTEHGRATPDQTAVLADLAASGFRTHIWRPSDLDAVHTALTGGTP